MVDLLHFIVWDFLRVLVIGLFFISIPVGCLLLVDRMYKKEAVRQLEAVKGNASQMLRLRGQLIDRKPDKAGFEERAVFAPRNALKGIVIFVVAALCTAIKEYIAYNPLDETLAFALGALLIFIELFMFKDLLAVAPWRDIYTIRVLCLLEGQHGYKYVLYHDFVRDRLAVERMYARGFNRGQVASVLAVRKGKSVKLVGR